MVCGVVAPEKRVAENGQRTNRLGEVHTHERRDARALNLKNVVKGADSEVITTEREGKVGQAVALVTLYSVLTIEALLGADFLVAGND